MLDNIFSAVLSMSAKASIVVLAVLLLRLTIRKAPKIFSYALWLVVLFRLLCPVSFRSSVGLFPGLAAVPAAQSTVTADTPDNTLVPAVSPEKEPGDVALMVPVTPPEGAGLLSETTLSFWDTALLWGKYLWLAGALILLCKNLLALYKLRRALAVSLPAEENVFLADQIDSPFVLGLFRPKIYLPSSLREEEQEFILRHERCHIRRGDHAVKVLFFLALCLHWFNPLIWLAFSLFSRDMEMSCDEAVMKQMEGDIRTSYSEAILRFASGKHSPAAAPLAFAEGDAKSRIKNVLSYRKPAFWLVAVSAMLLVAAGIFLLADPKDGEPSSPFDQSYQVTAHDDSMTSLSSIAFSLETAPYYHIYPDGQLYTRTYDSTQKDWDRIGTFKEVELTKDNFDRYFYGLATSSMGKKLRRDNFAAWQIIAKEEHPSLYYLLQQKDGSLLLCYGYYDEEGETDPYSDDSYIQGISTLSPMKDHALPVEEIVTEPISFDIYIYSDSPDPLLPSLMLARETDDFQFCYSGLSSYIPMGTYHYEGDLLILSSSIDDNRYCFHVDGENFVFDEALSSPIPSYRYSADSYESLCPVPDGAVFTSAKEPVKSDALTDYEQKLNEAILSAFVYYLPNDPTGLLYAQSYVILDTETASGTPLLGKDDDLVEKTFYLATMFASYSTYGGTLSVVTEYLYPAAVTISIENGEVFTVTDMWFPDPNDQYEAALRGRFPHEAAEKAMNIEQYTEELTNQCLTIALSKLEEIGGVDTVIGSMLALIANSGTTAEDAISSCKEEYELLLGYKEFTLRYCFTKFFEGDQTDLAADIMVKLCRDIIRKNYPSVKNTRIVPGDYDPAHNTAQDWFDLFYKNCLELEKKEGARGLAECEIAYLLLQTADDLQ